MPVLERAEERKSGSQSYHGLCQAAKNWIWTNQKMVKNRISLTVVSQGHGSNQQSYSYSRNYIDQLYKQSTYKRYNSLAAVQ